MAVHEHYKQLSSKEKWFVDEVFKEAFDLARLNGINLAGDDRCESAVDAFSKLVLHSRKEQQCSKN